MWEYKIYKTDLWWSIYRRKQIGKMLIVEYLNGHGAWTWNKQMAKTFYHEDDAVGALVINRHKDEKKSD